jgi:hypothetical protein
MTTFENFNQELASIDLEIARLAQLCGIRMLEPGVAERCCAATAVCAIRPIRLPGTSCAVCWCCITTSYLKRRPPMASKRLPSVRLAQQSVRDRLRPKQQ